MTGQQVQEVDAELERVLGLRPPDWAVCVPVLERAAHLCRTDPAAAEMWVEAELLGELVDCYAAVGRVDDAITAMRRAMEVGWAGRPDGRCRIAELLIRNGRPTEAAPLWRQVRADTPDDVWLYNSAGGEYAAVGNYDEALTWLTRGVQVAMATGDPERLLPQLTEMRRGALAMVGRPADELQNQAAAFRANPPPTQTTRSRVPVVPETPPGASATRMTGFRQALQDRLSPPPGRADPVPGEQMVLALAWFPAEDYQEALVRWPELATEGAAKGGKDHAAYNRALQRTLQDYADRGITRLFIAPIRIPAYLAWCNEQSRDPADARAGYAAAVARRGDPSLMVWPPGRNQRCWCGSGRKYKQCCGTART